MSLVTWETGDGLDVRAKNVPNLLRNTEMSNPSPEAQLTPMAGDLRPVKLLYLSSGINVFENRMLKRCPNVLLFFMIMYISCGIYVFENPIIKRYPNVQLFFIVGTRP